MVFNDSLTGSSHVLRGGAVDVVGLVDHRLNLLHNGVDYRLIPRR